LARAINGRAANLVGTLPDDLREVSPAVECSLVVDVRWSSLAI
jgi:hypothetical protein